VAPLDAMTIRLHLRGTRVLEVVEDLPERLVVAVAAIASVIAVVLRRQDQPGARHQGGQGG
jgi:hypothetical protein